MLLSDLEMREQDKVEGLGFAHAAVCVSFERAGTTMFSCVKTSDTISDSRAACVVYHGMIRPLSLRQYPCRDDNNSIGFEVIFRIPQFFAT